MKNIGNNKQTSPHAEMDERIAQFLRGQMSQADADAFRAEMKENPKLRERAVTMARLIKQMKAVGEERQQRVMDAMQAVDRKTIQQIAQGKGEEMMKEKNPVLRRLMPWVAAAAVLCCVVLLGRYAMSTEGRSAINHLASAWTTPKENTEQHAAVQVAELPKEVVVTEHDKLEELALLRGKVDMGLDLEETTERLQAIFDEAKQNTDSLYTSLYDDIAYALAEGYHKVGNTDAETLILNDLLAVPDDNYMSAK